MKPPTIKIKSAGFAKKERKPKEPRPARSLYRVGELMKPVYRVNDGIIYDEQGTPVGIATYSRQVK